MWDLCFVAFRLAGAAQVIRLRPKILPGFKDSAVIILRPFAAFKLYVG